MANVVASALLVGAWSISAVLFRFIARNGFSRAVSALRNADPAHRKLCLIRAVAAPWFNIPTIAIVIASGLQNAFSIQRVAQAFAPFYEASGGVKPALVGAAATLALAASSSSVVAFHFAEKARDPIGAFDIAWGAGAAVAGACMLLSVGAFLVRA